MSAARASAARAADPRASALESPAVPRGNRAEAPARPSLRVVSPPPFRAPRGPFVLVVGSVLTLGLLGVLGLNMLVAQDAFALNDLRRHSSALADREQALTQQVAMAESPARLEQRARALGMVPSVNPVFLRLADGAVLGEADAPEAPVVRPPASTQTTPTTPGTTPQAVKTKRAAR